jgi:ferric-dicitrate binding protein FerR (iron transport regulator)
LQTQEVSKVKSATPLKVRNLFLVLRNTAAIFMLPVLGFGLYMTSKYISVQQYQATVSTAYNEVFSSVDAITKVTLPDNTTVWLNHSSSLRYPATFRKDFRTVELTGEAYFEVAHNVKFPFVVKTGDIEIVAMGTAFNILAYPDEDKIETSLIDGIVEVHRHDKNGELIEMLQMMPTDLVVYTRSNMDVIKHTISDDRYFAWKEGKLIFNKEPMGEVVRKLSRWFNVDMQINDPKLLELTFTGTFINETLPQVLELMELIIPVKYSVSARHELSSGTFSKRTVTLKYSDK